MDYNEQTKYLRIACNIAKLGLNDEQLYLLLSLYELIKDKKGKADVQEICDLETKAKNETNSVKRSKLLDEISEEI